MHCIPDTDAVHGYSAVETAATGSFFIPRPRFQPTPDRNNHQRQGVIFYPGGFPFKAGRDAVRRQQKRVRVSQRATQGFRLLVVLLHPVSRWHRGYISRSQPVVTCRETGCTLRYWLASSSFLLVRYHVISSHWPG